MKVVLTLEDGTTGADYVSALLTAGFARDQILALYSRDAPPAEFDGLLLSGGEDVDPPLYGQDRHEKLGRVNRRRDEQELALIASARRKRAPIFGICRGLQALNVAYGGTLVQDLPALRPSFVRHSVKSPREFRAHGVTAEAGSFLAPRESRRFEVNSRHHQGIERLGEGLRACAYSDNGLIEAVEAPPSGQLFSPIFAVEWHPENLKEDPDARSLFEKFYAAVSDFACGA